MTRRNDLVSRPCNKYQTQTDGEYAARLQHDPFTESQPGSTYGLRGNVALLEESFICSVAFLRIRCNPHPSVPKRQGWMDLKSCIAACH